MSIGFILPFAKSTGSIGHFAMTETVTDAIKQDIKSLALTNWGERPMNYDLGFNLREFLFEQKDDFLRDKIIDRAENQMSRWLSFIRIDNISVLFSEDDSSIPENGILIVIDWKLLDNQNIGGTIQILTS